MNKKFIVAVCLVLVINKGSAYKSPCLGKTLSFASLFTWRKNKIPKHILQKNQLKLQILKYLYVFTVKKEPEAKLKALFSLFVSFFWQEIGKTYEEEKQKQMLHRKWMKISALYLKTQFCWCCLFSKKMREDDILFLLKQVLKKSKIYSFLNIFSAYNSSAYLS